MVYEDLNEYERIELPEEREAPDIGRKKDKDGVSKYSSKVRGNSVTPRTMVWSIRLLSLIIFLVFVGIILYGSYVLVSIFSNG